jgi:GNAT superfamily N-acetyltransferase
MVVFVPFNLDIHKEIFVKLNIELITWIADQLKENYNFDPVANIGQEISDYVATHLEDFTALKPPNGIVYLLDIEGSIVGMGALKKLKHDVGEIKRMYIQPSYRGKGYGKLLLNKLLEKGRVFGCSTFRLETSRFMKAAQHIYNSAGFVERGEYPEVETPVMRRQYQIFMEKAEH